MLYKTVSLAFCASTVSGFSPAMPSKIASSRVARVSDIEMAKKSVGDLTEADLKGKKVLVRCDLNVPLDGKTITDDTRIRASVPTVKYLMEKGAKVLLSSHLGRPKEGPEDVLLGPVAPRLSELLGTTVEMAPDCTATRSPRGRRDVGLGPPPREHPLLQGGGEERAEFAEARGQRGHVRQRRVRHRAPRARLDEGVTKYLSPSVAGFLAEGARLP